LMRASLAGPELGGESMLVGSPVGGFPGQRLHGGGLFASLWLNALCLGARDLGMLCQGDGHLVLGGAGIWPSGGTG